MIVKHKKDDKTIAVTVSGKIDTNTSPDFLEEIKGLLAEPVELIIDLKEVDYISSAGLRVILYAKKNLNPRGKLTIINPCDTVYEVFELTGFADILNIVR